MSAPASTRWPGAILFDLDGTLADSVPDLAGALNELFSEQGWEAFTPDGVKAMVGGGVPKLIERALGARNLDIAPDRQQDLVSRFLSLYAPRATRLTRLYPGVRDVLEELSASGVGLGVCTNKPEAVTLSMLEGLGISHFFGAVIGGDTLPVKKPDAGPVLEALKRLDCEPSESLMVGDSGADAGAAGAAGIPVILVAYGYTREPVESLPNDGIIDTMSGLQDAIGVLSKSGRGALAQK